MTDNLKDAAKRVAFAAMSKTQAKDYNSERFTKVIVDQGCYTVATNGHRLAYCMFGNEKTTEYKFEVDPKTGTVLSPEPYQYYPDWQRTLPGTREPIALDRKKLLEVLSTIQADAKVIETARKEANKAKKYVSKKSKADSTEVFGVATFALAEGRVDFSLDLVLEEKSLVGSGRYMLISEEPGNHDVTLGFNIKYLIEAVKVTRGDRILWSLSIDQPHLRAFEIRAEGDDLTNVVMPVRFRHRELDPQEVEVAAAPTVAAKTPAKKTATKTTKPSKPVAPKVVLESPSQIVPEPAQTAHATEGESIKIQMKRGERHWRTKKILTKISDARLEIQRMRGALDVKNKSWRAIQGDKVLF